MRNWNTLTPDHIANRRLGHDADSYSVELQSLLQEGTVSQGGAYAFVWETATDNSKKHQSKYDNRTKKRLVQRKR